MILQQKLKNKQIKLCIPSDLFDLLDKKPFIYRALGDQKEAFFLHISQRGCVLQYRQIFDSLNEILSIRVFF